MKISKTWREKLATTPFYIEAHFEEGDSVDIAMEDDLLDIPTEEELDKEILEILQAKEEDIEEVAEATSQTSEDVHGGSEATGDIEDSPNALDEGEQENETSESEDDDEEFFEQEEGEEEEEEPTEKNNNQAFNIEAARKRRLSHAFSSVISKVAEDLEGSPAEGDDEWDITALMERKITRRPITHCRQSREKISVVLVLDTSGSCYNQASFFGGIAKSAAQMGDVEMYNAPNAITESKYQKGKWVRNNERWWDIKNRTILFFGDFDGGDAPVIASKNNKVYWFSCEDRYSDMNYHNWCNYTLADYKGKYYECLQEEDFFKLIKKIR